MADATSRPDSGADAMDDDALADAILATYTSSIPIIRQAPTAPQEPEPAPEPVSPPVAEDGVPPGSMPSMPVWPSAAPSAAPPSAAPPRAAPPQPEPVSESVDSEEPPAGRVWDLGDPEFVESEPEPGPAPEPWTRLVSAEPTVEQVAEQVAESAAGEQSGLAASADASPGSDQPGSDQPAWDPPVWEPGPAVVAVEQTEAPEAPEPEAAREPAPELAAPPTPWFDLAAAPPPNPSAMARHLPPPADTVAEEASAVGEIPADAVDERPSEPEPPSTPWSVSAPPFPIATPDPADYPPPTPTALVEPPEAAVVSAPEWPQSAPAPEAGSESETAADQSATITPVVEASPASDLSVAGAPLGGPYIAPDEEPVSFVAPAAPAAPDGAGPVAPSDPVDRATAAETTAVATGLPSAFALEGAGLEATPEERRVARSGRLFWTWIAANSSLLGLSIGGAFIAMGMSLRQALISGIGGVALSFLPLGVAAVAGRRTGQPTLVVSRATFGLVGNILPALLALITRAVWGGILIWIGVDAARAVLGLIGVRLSSAAADLLGVGLVGLLAALLAIAGFGLLARAQAVLGIVTAVIVVGVIALTASRVNLAAALRIADGPWLLVVSGVVMVFALVGLAWAQSGSDVARYQSRRGSGASTSLLASLGAGLPPLVLIGWGALLAASSQSFARAVVDSPVEALQSLLPSWFPAPLLLLVLAASLAGASLAFYSGGFALQAAGLRVGRPVGAAIAAILSIALALALEFWRVPGITTVRDLLTTVAVPAAAWAGIFGVDVLLGARRYHAPSLLRRGGIYPDVRVAHLVALVVASGLGFGLTTATMPGLSWQGWVFDLLGIPASDPLAASDLGVIVAFALALLVPLVGALATAGRPRRDAVSTPA